MFFKPLIAVGLIAVFGSACSLFRDESKDPVSSIGMGIQDADCLENAGERVALFLDGQGGVENIDGLWDCVDRSLTLFIENTRGQNEDSYAPNELRRFLEKYFLGSLRISDDLLTEAMNLKSAVVGGSSELISRMDLERTRKLIQVLKSESRTLLPYMPWTPDRVMGLRAEALDDSIQVVSGSLGRIGAVLDGGSEGYTFDSLVGLTLGLSRMLEGRPGGDKVTKTLRYLPLMMDSKALWIGGSGDCISAGEWGILLKSAGQAYGLALQAAHLSGVYPSLSHGQGLNRLEALSKVAFGEASKWISRHSDGIIPFAVTDRLLDRLGELNLIPFGIQAQTLRALSAPFVNRMLIGSRKGIGTDVNGLNLQALERPAQSLSAWVEGQRFLAERFTTIGGADGVSQVVLHPGDLFSEYSGMSVGGIFDSLGLIRRAVRLIPPLFHPQKDLVYIGDHDDSALSFRGLTWTNSVQLFMMMVAEGYVQDDDRVMKLAGLNMDEYDAIYQDLFDIGADMKTLNRETRYTSAPKRFVEGNLFTSRANGNDLLELEEATELLIFMFSGKALSSRIHSEAIAVCMPNGVDPNHGYDQMDQPKVETQCYRRLLRDRLASWFEHTPGTVEYLASVETDRKWNYARSLLEIIGRNCMDSDEDYFTTDDADGIATVPYYVESMLRRFDRGTGADSARDGVIDENEALEAFSVFDGVLHKTLLTADADYSGLDPSVQLRRRLALFTYALKNGRFPEDTTDKLRFKGWENAGPSHPSEGPKKWVIRAGRAEILGAIASVSLNMGKDSRPASCKGPILPTLKRRQ